MMVPDTKLVPEVNLCHQVELHRVPMHPLTDQAFRLLVCDALALTEVEYDIVVSQVLADMDEKDAQAVS